MYYDVCVHDVYDMYVCVMYMMCVCACGGQRDSVVSALCFHFCVCSGDQAEVTRLARQASLPAGPSPQSSTSLSFSFSLVKQAREQGDSLKPAYACHSQHLTHGCHSCCTHRRISCPDPTWHVSASVLNYSPGLCRRRQLLPERHTPSLRHS